MNGGPDDDVEGLVTTEVEMVMHGLDEAVRRRLLLLTLVEQGQSIAAAARTLGVGEEAYAETRKLVDDGGEALLRQRLREAFGCSPDMRRRIHAPLTARSSVFEHVCRRLDAIDRVDAGQSIWAACTAVGISRTAYFTARRNMVDGGLERLWRRVAHRYDRAEGDRAVEEVLQTEPQWGATRIARALARMGLPLSERVVGSILRERRTRTGSYAV